MRRRLARRAHRGRGRCLRRYARTPGRVSGLHARALSSTKIELAFTAPGTDANLPPPAHSYLVKQSRRPIHSERDFAHAQTLCHGHCRFNVTNTGATVTLTVTDLRPHTTYYYTVAARDNISAHRGPRSQTVHLRTRG